MATIEDGRLTDIDSHPEHVSSQGHFCRKARGMIDITYDADRLLYPMKRTGAPGEFERISWDQALTEICDRLEHTRGQYGKDALARTPATLPHSPMPPCWEWVSSKEPWASDGTTV